MNNQEQLKEDLKAVKNGESVKYSSEYAYMELTYIDLPWNRRYSIWFNGVIIYTAKTVRSVIKKAGQLVNDYGLEKEA